MNVCDVCGQEFEEGKGSSLHLYKARVLKKGVSKNRLGSTVVGQYKDFKEVDILACPRHRRLLWNQYLLTGLVVFVVLFIPISILLKALFDFKNTGSLVFYITALVGLIPAILLPRRIKYDALVANLLNIQPQTREAGVEYFYEAKYRRIMRRLAAVDAEIERAEKMK